MPSCQSTCYVHRSCYLAYLFVKNLSLSDLCLHLGQLLRTASRPSLKSVETKLFYSLHIDLHFDCYYTTVQFCGYVGRLVLIQTLEVISMTHICTHRHTAVVADNDFNGWTDVVSACYLVKAPHHGLMNLLEIGSKIAKWVWKPICCHIVGVCIQNNAV